VETNCTVAVIVVLFRVTGAKIRCLFEDTVAVEFKERLSVRLKSVILEVTFITLLSFLFFFYSFFCNQFLNKHDDHTDWIRLRLHLPGGGILCTGYRGTEDQ